jgi:uncharacterized protein YndB with AHSA1/START domain
MRRSGTPIEPVRKERHVPLAVADAFELFTLGMGSWWPLPTHSVAGEAALDVRFEGRVGGRVTEITRDGAEHPWAEVLTWDPPHRVVLAWHPTPEPAAASTIEVRFTPLHDGTRLWLEHRDWEEFGASAGADLRAGYDPGWDVVLAPYEARAGG